MALIKWRKAESCLIKLLVEEHLNLPVLHQLLGHFTEQREGISTPPPLTLLPLASPDSLHLPEKRNYLPCVLFEHC